MRKSRAVKFFKKFHKWLAIVIAFVALLFASSGIVMNHRQTFSSIDVSRKLLPANYTYKNWNQAAVRGSLNTSEGNYIYGNIGIWKSTDKLESLQDFNQGFPKGIDNRKIYALEKFGDELFAGTQLGLYKRNLNNSEWTKVALPVKKDRIADLELKENELLVLTRHYLLSSKDGKNFERIQLPEPIGYERKTGLFDTFWELHSGELFGLPGKLLVDLLGLVTILLSITGLLHFFLPKIIRRRRKKQKDTAALVSTRKSNLNWHNVVGYIFVLFLVINTFSGMHLRPPILIAIANKEVGIIPGTHLDSPNPWFDKLRRVHWDAAKSRYIFSTKEGFFFADESLSNKLVPAPSQPPVSVMGCNVLESIDANRMMVGSFSGMYLWNTHTGEVKDYFSGKPHQPLAGMQRPIGQHMVAGFVYDRGRAWWFDYSLGAREINAAQTGTFPSMTNELRKASPMSLWNVSLEVHTGRIFENILGSFYILFVPIAGICVLLVLISGFFIWLLVYRKSERKSQSKE